MPIFDIVSSVEGLRRPLYQFGHSSEALDNQFFLLSEFTKHAENYFSKVFYIN
jgi:hypothetical protein